MLNKKSLFAAVSAAALFGLAAPACADIIEMTGTADGGDFINSAAPAVTSTIDIMDDLFITDIDVEINLSHTWVGDLAIDLIGPDSTQVRLMGDGGDLFDDGGSGDNLVMTVFDDEALVSITDAEGTDAPYTGSWLPREALSAFDGTSSLGAWTLRVLDTAGGDDGTFGDWTITITGERSHTVGVSEPATLALLGLGLVGVAATRRRKR